MENKIERGEIESNEWEYQLRNDQKYYLAESKMLKNLDRLLVNKPYSSVALQNTMAKTYDPDLEKWINKLNHHLEEHWNASLRAMLNKQELIDAYDIMSEYASDDTMKFIKDSLENTDNERLKEEYEFLKNMRKNPLQIPEEYKYEKRIYPLRQALYDTEAPLNKLVEYYDPDPLEWRN